MSAGGCVNRAVGSFTCCEGSAKPALSSSACQRRPARSRDSPFWAEAGLDARGAVSLGGRLVPVRGLSEKARLLAARGSVLTGASAVVPPLHAPPKVRAPTPHHRRHRRRPCSSPSGVQLLNAPFVSKPNAGKRSTAESSRESRGPPALLLLSQTTSGSVKPIKNKTTQVSAGLSRCSQSKRRGKPPPTPPPRRPALPPPCAGCTCLQKGASHL